ncbi:ATP-dependent DNA ligase [Microlunatus speluncae]|uniref:ATP-dependent DNA ligase n=1 Tax=Microlunatus speluncae TaxID=2594267 RepID=UPI001FE7043D|nr:ATP-dependent DNA ligase [Microlunatus speluncae]
MVETAGMQLERVAAASAAMAATRSRIAKRELIAEVLRDGDAAEIEIVVAYLAGSLRQRRTGIGWRTISKAPTPAVESTLTVAEVDAAFQATAELSGAGSAGRRAEVVAELFGRATAAEQRLLAGLVSGELRQGALEAQVQEGLAVAYEVPLAAVRRAAMLSSSTTAAARVLVDGGLAALERVGLSVGTGIQPMLAASAPDVAAAAAKSGLPALVDHKLDGIRVQVHKDGDTIRMFTRSLDEITERLPEVSATVAALPYRTLVLDGEVLAFQPDGKPESFQVTASRTGSQLDVAGHSERTPLRGYFFDLLHLDGRDLLDEPLTERTRIMTEVLPDELIVPRRVCATEAELTAVFGSAVADGYEGVVVKRLDSPYAAGRRDAAWIKIKPRHTLDLLVIAAEWGHGRRQGWLSNLHLAARDPRGGEPIMLGKTFKGMTDKLLTWQTERFQELETSRDDYTVYLRPETVVEIAFDGLQRSTRYPGGVALRFARVLRYREDKTADQADTLDTVLALGAIKDEPGD